MQGNDSFSSSGDRVFLIEIPLRIPGSRAAAQESAIEPCLIAVIRTYAKNILPFRQNDCPPNQDMEVLRRIALGKWLRILLPMEYGNLLYI